MLKIYEKPQFEMTIIRNQDIISISGNSGLQPSIDFIPVDNVTGYKS